MTYYMAKAGAITEKPMHLGVTFSCNERPTYFTQLRDKFDSNGLNTRFQKQAVIARGPSVLLSEVFQNPAQGSVERLDIFGTLEEAERPAVPSDPPDWKDIGLVTEYTKQFLEARGLLVENPKEKPA